VTPVTAVRSRSGVNEPVGEIEGEEGAREENTRQLVDGGSVFNRSWGVYGWNDGGDHLK